jgi:hypothetical protein
MLACQVTPKDNDRTLKGQQDVLAFIVVESGPINKVFQNTYIKVATKHHFIQIQVNMFNCWCIPTSSLPKKPKN